MGASSLTFSVEVAFVLSEVDSKNYRAYFVRTQNEMFMARPRSPGDHYFWRLVCPQWFTRTLTKLG